MKKSVLLLASAAALALSAPAFAADETYKSETKVEKSDNGDYKSKSVVTGTDANGTDSKVEKDVKVDASKDGSSKTTVTKESMSDPKGLGNKHKTKDKMVVKNKKDGNTETTHTKTVDGKKVVDEKTNGETK